jgi:hypothetical protein
MKIAPSFGGQLCGILSACWSESYKSYEDFASDLERLATLARAEATRLRAEQTGDRIIG